MEIFANNRRFLRNFDLKATGYMFSQEFTNRKKNITVLQFSVQASNKYLRIAP